MKKKQTGFTLVEVIVALALFAVSVLVLTQSFLNGLICKTTLAKEDDRPFIYQMIRSDLNRLKRDQVPSNHAVVLPDNKTRIEWQGKVAFADMINLYQVNVRIKNDTEDIVFYEYSKDNFRMVLAKNIRPKKDGGDYNANSFSCYTWQPVYKEHYAFTSRVVFGGNYQFVEYGDDETKYKKISKVSSKRGTNF